MTGAGPDEHPVGGAEPAADGGREHGRAAPAQHPVEGGEDRAGFVTGEGEEVIDARSWRIVPAASGPWPITSPTASITSPPGRAMPRNQSPPTPAIVSATAYRTPTRTPLTATSVVTTSHP
ncbi:hypothetical protein GCM10027610_129820 [Dactylosporangium cerinum]